MPVKIDGYTSFDDAFKQSPELVWTVAKSLLAGRSHEERHALLHDLALAAAKTHQDEQLLVLLQMKRKLTEESAKAEFATRMEYQYSHERERAAESAADARYRAYIADLFWQLPDSRQEQTYVRDQDGSRYEDGLQRVQTLVTTKARIFRELLGEWSYQATEKSVHAFRRAIAMGWPLSAQFKQLFAGESDSELRARGRFVGQDEQKQYSTAVREHLGRFDSYEVKKHGADAVFAPWLAQQRVPEDIEKMLVVARAKMGGIEMARRDVRYASVLDGLPESGIDLLRVAADEMRARYADAQSVVKEVVETIRKRNPYWRGDTVPHTISFKSQKELTISFDRCQSDEDQSTMFGDANVAIAAAEAVGRFKGCTVRLDVRQSDEGTAILRNAWYC
jgi:hypothetical protein